MNLTQLKNDELTHYRLTITVDKKFTKMLDDLLLYIDENLLANTSEQIHEVFQIEKGGIYKAKYYRELNDNEYNVSLGEPKVVDNA